MNLLSIVPPLIYFVTVLSICAYPSSAAPPAAPVLHQSAIEPHPSDSALPTSTRKSTGLSAFPEYTYLQHPLYNSNKYTLRRPGDTAVPQPSIDGTEEASTNPPKPVIMKKYYFLSGRQNTALAFAPRLLTYYKRGETTPYFEDLDCLVGPNLGDPTKSTKYITMQLNAPARVIVLLSGRKIKPKLVPVVTSFGFSNVVNNTHEWKNPTVVTGSNREWTGRKIRRFGFPTYAVAVETEVGAGETLVLPHPRHFRVNVERGGKADHLSVLFAQPANRSDGSAIKGFPYPGLPPIEQVQKLNPEIKDEDLTYPIPNESCPSWLHDIHVVPNKNPALVDLYGEDTHWRTWHPMIDPVYWCYYDHDHGAYPGWYRPPFGYTPRKTLVNITNMGLKPQMESHNGFKIYALTLPENKVVVITLHSHMGSARRFTTRFHTVMFDVFECNEEGEWIEIMNLRMKMDFGFAQLLRGSNEVTGQTISYATENDKALDMMMRRRFKKVAKRRFNVYTELPLSSTRASLFNQTNEIDLEAISRQVKIIVGKRYEKWLGPLNTCMSSTVTDKATLGLEFDIQDPATAIVDPLYPLPSGNELQFVNRGESIKRIVSLSKIVVGISACRFKEDPENGLVWDLEATKGVFYTDPFFTKLVHGPNFEALEQYIAPSFEDLALSGGKYAPKDYWNAELQNEREALARGEPKLRQSNNEGASDRSVN